MAIDAFDGGSYASLDLEGAQLCVSNLPAADFPEFPGVSAHETTAFSMMSDVHAEAFSRVYFAISTEASRCHLMGIYVHTVDIKGTRMLRMVATDGRRMAIRTGDLPAEVADYRAGFPGFIVPAVTVKDVLALMGKRKPPVPVTVTLSGGRADKPVHIAFACGVVEIRSKLIDGTIPTTAA